MVYNTGETDESLRNEYNPEGSMLRKVQMRLLEMLIYIDQVCQENKIDYQLNSGNVLGAIRHQGFIPWDDDIDIILTPKEYKRLCDYLYLHPHSQFKIQNHKTDRHYYRFWSTLRDTKSEYVNDIYVDKFFKYKGLVIDIFPYENRVIGMFKRITVKLCNLNTKYLIGKHPFLANHLYNLQEKILHPCFRLLGILFGKKDIFTFSYGIGFKSKARKEVLFPSKKLQFEGYSFNGPNSPIEYLQATYKNFMDLPPKDVRNNHKCGYKIWL